MNTGRDGLEFILTENEKEALAFGEAVKDVREKFRTNGERASLTLSILIHRLLIAPAPESWENCDHAADGSFDCALGEKCVLKPKHFGSGPC